MTIYSKVWKFDINCTLIIFVDSQNFNMNFQHAIDEITNYFVLSTKLNFQFEFFVINRLYYNIIDIKFSSFKNKL